MLQLHDLEAQHAQHSMRAQNLQTRTDALEMELVRVRAGVLIYNMYVYVYVYVNSYVFI